MSTRFQRDIIAVHPIDYERAIESAKGTDVEVVMDEEVPIGLTKWPIETICPVPA